MSEGLRSEHWAQAEHLRDQCGEGWNLGLIGRPSRHLLGQGGTAQAAHGLLGGLVHSLISRWDAHPLDQVPDHGGVDQLIEAAGLAEPRVPGRRRHPHQFGAPVGLIALRAGMGDAEQGRIQAEEGLLEDRLVGERGERNPS